MGKTVFSNNTVTDFVKRLKMVQKFQKKYPQTEEARILILQLQKCLWPFTTVGDAKEALKIAEEQAKKLKFR